MAETYIIINDRYSRQPDEVTFMQLQDLCEEMDWETRLRIVGDNIVNQNDEVVAIRTTVYNKD